MAFDAQITHNIIKNHKNLKLMDGESIAEEIFSILSWEHASIEELLNDG
mgnify:CR=1 FL=1